MNNLSRENDIDGLRQQEAPEKNTDRAFVKVKKDGSSEMPQAEPVKDADRSRESQEEKGSEA